MRAGWVLATCLVLMGCADNVRESPPAARGERPAGETGEPAFSADSSWAYLVRQVEFGPRVPGTQAHLECRDWLAATLARMGGEVEVHPFSYRDPQGTEWPLFNVFARFGPPGGNRLLLFAHWDSRPWADEDPDPARRSEPVLGANDGASGVAVLLEVARHLAASDLPRGVDILFTDGEDLGTADNFDGFLRGAKEFAATRDLTVYRRGILLDMVGGVGLRLGVEGNSVQRAPEVVDWVWKRGVELSPEAFTYSPGVTLYDDHMALLDAGLPCVDVVDFNFPGWHTVHDDLRGVDRLSLESVGRVVLSLARHP